MTREESKSKAVSNECKILVDKIYDDFEKNRQAYDLKIKSNDMGYISGLSWFGRAKPNTTYKVYVEEEDDNAKMV